MSDATDEVSHELIGPYYGDASRQTCVKNHNIKVDNNSVESVEQSKYLGTTLAYQNSSHEKIKRRLKPRNACYSAVWLILKNESGESRYFSLMFAIPKCLTHI